MNSCELWNLAVDARKRGDDAEAARLEAMHEQAQADEDEAAVAACPMKGKQDEIG